MQILKIVIINVKNLFLTEKTKIMAADPLVINRTTIINKKIKIVKQFKYLGEIITYYLNEKPPGKKEQIKR